tara:strand:+ start:1 stop:882 length:882 start_codon:yes stop_codon:yes gene_type:complete
MESEDSDGEGYFRNQNFILAEDGFAISTNESCMTSQSQSPKSLAVVNAPMEGQFSINSVLVGDDFMMQYTGDNPFTGSIHHGREYFGFYHGYISSHNVSCAVNQIPQTSTNITVFGDIGGAPDYFAVENSEDYVIQQNDFGIAIEGTGPEESYNASGSNPFPEIRIPDPGSIRIECAGSETDRVVSFQHSVNVNLRPIYVVGKSGPVQVDVAWPIITTTTFTLEVDEYEYHRMKEYLIKPKIDDIAIKVNDCFGNKIHHYIIRQARMIGEQVTSSTEGRLTVILTYNSYYNKR